MFLRNVPFFKLLAVVQVAILAGRHYRHLQADERRRIVELARKGKAATPKEREELRALVDKIDLRGLAGGAASRLSPFPLPKRFSGSRY